MQTIKNFTSKVKGWVNLALRKRRKIQGYLGQAVVYILLITVSYVFLYPLFNMISLSFMSPQDVINPEVDWIPKSFYFGNFTGSLEVLNGFSTFFNSFWFSTILAVSQTIVSAMTGFAFARYEFSGKKILFGMILVSFIVPVPIILIPRIMMIVNTQEWMQSNLAFIEPLWSMQLMGTPIPQIVFALLGQGVNSAILILIFYNFFRLIPPALYEAARIDGAGPFAQFYHITIRMSFSTIVVVFLFSFVWNWNETYITGLLLSEGLQLLPTQLGAFDSLFTSRPPSVPGLGGTAQNNEAFKMAATFITMLPLFILYAFAQKQFIEGIEQTGITGE
jgi:multiple sugar transport system permease protein